MIQLYSLAVFLTGNVREAASTVRAKNAPWKSSASWQRNNLAWRPGGFEAILTREKMGSTGIGNGIAIPHGKLEEDTLRAVGVFVQLETPIAFDAIDNQPVDLLLPCWCRQTKLKRTCILCRWWRNVWRTKPSAAVYAQPRAMKSCIKSLRIPKVLRMKRSYSVMSLLDVVRRNSTWY